MICALAQGPSPLGGGNVVFILYIFDVILTHILNVILMHVLDVLIRIHTLDVLLLLLLLLLLLATMVIAPLFWELHCCNNSA